VGFSLIRVHKEQILPMTSDSLHLQQLKWPVEYMFVGAKVRDYYAPATDALRRQHLQAWDSYSVYTDTNHSTNQTILQEAPLVADLGAVTTLGISALGIGTGTGLAHQAVPVNSTVRIAGSLYVNATLVAAGAALTGLTLFPISGVATAASTAVAAAATVVTYVPSVVQARSWAPILTTLSVQAHGIDIYKDLPAGFFNAYTTYHFGGPNINAPKDVGQLFVPFCLYPGTYQPSGHINVSRAREFYVKYTSAYQVANPAVVLHLVVIASAINFLLISDGSAVLRYST
jgi:hypothetical protein